MKRRALELFAGDRSFGKVAEKKGFEVFSVDWEQYEGIDLVKDIEHLKVEDIPFLPDVVWLSPDCTTYTIAAISTHRRNRTEPFSDYAKKCDRVNQNAIRIVKVLLKFNPDLVFFIENPRGMLRHMPFMQEFQRHTVWYCQYGDDRAKPTDIWTNSKVFVPRPECRNYKYDKDGNIIDRHCHHQSARRGAKTGTQGRKNAYERSKIPEELCEQIIISTM
jgi:site-specific DNA-cytosine methylase